MKTVNIIKSLTPLLAMVVVFLLVREALSQGINGAMLMTGLAIVGGLGGYEIKSTIDRRKVKSQNGKKEED